MKIPQIIMITIFGINLGMNLIKHGEIRIYKFDFGITLLVTILEWALLYAGGFFK